MFVNYQQGELPMPRIYRHLILLLVLALAILSVPTPALAATLWVGNSPECTGSNVYGNLNAALLAAAFTTADDEIRITGTMSYLGNLPDLVDWHPGVAGRLTLAGGYGNCFASQQSGWTILGNSSGTLLTVETSSQPSSVVTLQHLLLSGAGGRALEAKGGASVTLDNVWIKDNPSGISITTGASVIVQADSIVEDNDDASNGFGGGIDCFGGSYVGIAGRLTRNYANRGGNLYVGNGCTAELLDGAVIEGYFTGINDSSATFGGGAYVGGGGVLVSNGESTRVKIQGHHAGSNGGAIYVTGTGVAVLYNTQLLFNSSRLGGGTLYAVDGGTSSPQVIMDRAVGCPFTTDCSEIKGSKLHGDREGVAIMADNSLLEISRTMLNQNGNPSVGFEYSLVLLTNGSVLNIDGLGVSRNEVTRLFQLKESSIMNAAYVTTSLNEYPTASGTGEPWAVLLEGGSTLDVRNSILAEMKGIHSSGGSTVSASCLLVDTGNGMPAGSYVVGVADFVDAPNGNILQNPSSWGVDMCHDDGFSHTADRDISNNSRPVDNASNPNGSPGQAGGIFDAGLHEVQGNVSQSIFADGFESGDTSAWSSTSP